MKMLTQTERDELLAAMQERAAILARARKLRADVQQAFDDAAQWNHIHPQEQPIDPDPDGQLARIRDGLDRMLGAQAEAVAV